VAAEERLTWHELEGTGKAVTSQIRAMEKSHIRPGRSLVPTERHSDDAVLVTGAGRGLGLETALTLAQAGFHVWAGIRDMQFSASVKQVAHERGVKLETVKLDVTEPASIDAALEDIRNRSDGLFAVVNNAGITARAYFEDFPHEQIQRIFDVNLFGAMNVTRRALPFMRECRRGRIVMMSSVGGRIGSMSVAPYCASKFGLEGFGEALSLEVKPFGIHVSIIEPGIIETDIWDEERRILPNAHDPKRPYYDLFWAAEELAKKLLKTSRLRPDDVGRCVLRALTARKPRLRYTVGRRARFVVGLRRHLPGELFEKIYFGELLRRVSRNASGRRSGRAQQEGSAINTTSSCVSVRELSASATGRPGSNDLDSRGGYTAD
jgi:NAD(P)-dependent dehydrogenase (short-subunit alcohol dehydrogenase family)